MRLAWTMRLVAILILIARPQAAPCQGAYAGAKACATCHPAQASRQGLSPHAAALFPTSNHPLAGAFNTNGELLRPPAWRFEFFRENGALQTRITGPGGVMELPMQWAFGGGRQAVTF